MSKKLSLMGKLHHKYAYVPRIEMLVSLFSEKLSPNDRILDVGCGSGNLGSLLVQKFPELHIEGIDTHPRGDEPIPIRNYDGKVLPFEDNSFDVVIIADVLHHIKEPIEVLHECARVAKRLVIVKDNLRSNWFSYLRICLLDWGANYPHNEPCLYKYWSYSEWQQMFDQVGLQMESEVTSMKLYHWTLNFLFGGNIHFVSFVKPIKK